MLACRSFNSKLFNSHYYSRKKYYDMFWRKGLLALCIVMDFPIRINLMKMGLSIIYLRGQCSELHNYDLFKSMKFVLNSQKVLALVKCSIMLHFIWVFTVCKSTRLGLSRIQRVNSRVKLKSSK